MNNDNLIAEKIKALSEFRECDPEEIIFNGDCKFEIEIYVEEYLICQEEEAIILSSDYIKETLWAFEAKFLMDFIPSAFSFSITETEQLEKVIKNMQEEMCESCNLIITALVGKQLDRLINSALKDGIELFLADYDHKEIEKGEFFIYRTN